LGVGVNESLPERLGPYRIRGKLAAGGMGVVYRAEHEETGARAAVKTVKETRTFNLESFRREVHALGRIQHPGIIRILGHGVEAGVPWYAMDLVEGDNLRRLVTADRSDQATVRAAEAVPAAPLAPLAPERLQQVLEIVRRLCDALAFLHGEGIVHRDIKPENIVIRSDGEPVIVDFGLAAQFAGRVAREVVASGENTKAGTYGYMAPEQLRGELVDARADLYSLGCILYEALTGTLPASDQVPRPPSAVAPSVPVALDVLVRRLLAPRAADRLGYAGDVAAALGALLPSAAARSPTLPSRSYLYRPEFAGRGEALAALREHLTGNAGGLVLIGGESGSGKTRLVMEVARLAAPSHLRVIMAECVPVEGASRPDGFQAAPLHPLRPVLRAIADHCQLGGAAATERLLGRRVEVLGAYEASLAALPGASAYGEAAALPPQAARARLFADLSETLGAFVAERQLLLVLDDVQWADELTTSFLLAQLPRLREMGVLVVGTYRSEEMTEGLRQLAAVPSVRTIQLRRLDEDAVSSMIRGMLAMPVPPAPLVRYMMTHSEGNPFFVAEYLRAAVEAGLLERGRDGQWRLAGVGVELGPQPLVLPDSIRELVARRLDDLAGDAHRFVEAAAILGREFEPGLVSRMLGLTELGELEALRELHLREVVEQADENRFRFAHDKLREVAYAGLRDEARRALHEGAARTLERERAAEPAEAATLAHHFIAAGLEREAIDHLEKAGDHALATAAHGHSAQYYSRALGIDESLGGVVPATRRGTWLRRLAESRFGQGQIDESLQHARDAVGALYHRLPGSALGWIGLIAGSLVAQSLGALAGRARLRPRDQGALREAALASGQLASVHYFRGDSLPLVAMLLLGVRLAERARSPWQVTESYARLGYIAGVGGLHKMSARYFARAISAAQEGDAPGLGLTLYLHAFYHLGMGQWAAVEEKGGRAIELLLRDGNRQDAEVAHTIVGHALHFSGRLGEARSRYEQVLGWSRERANIQHEAWSLYLIGRNELVTGDAAHAADMLDRARGILREVSDRFSAVMCNGLLAQARLACGDLEGAEALALELHELLRGPPVPLAPCLHGYVGAAEVSLALWGRRRYEAPARRAAAESCARLRRFGRTFPVAVPAALRLDARRLMLEGARAKAVKLLTASARSARDLAMPYDAALADLDLSLALVREPSTAAEHRQRAIRELEALGCGRAVSGLTALSEPALSSA
jgi:tetratricopeptide (TPR) repeat protein